MNKLTIIINKLECLEKEHGKLGTIIGILIILISTLFAVGMLFLVSKWWLEMLNWGIGLIFKGWTLW